MARITPMVVLILVGLAVWLELSIMQWIIWGVTSVATICLAARLFGMVYPRAPSTVVEDGIEDAVVVYTWSETLFLNHVYLYVWAAFMVASFLVA